jgi:hypothetical protein
MLIGGISSMNSGAAKFNPVLVDTPSPAATALSTASKVVQPAQDSSFSTSVAGQQFWGSVDRAGGDYTATVPNLAGATASGSSQQSAEDHLNARIDELV